MARGTAAQGNRRGPRALADINLSHRHEAWVPSPQSQERQGVQADPTNALTRLLAELEAHKLEVVLVPSRWSDRRDWDMIRCAISRPPTWFSDLCNRHPSSRGYRRGFDTRIRRDTILSLLARLADNKPTRSKYASELIKIARKHDNPF